MPAHICATCGVQYTESDQPPEACKICEDERQYVGLDGQRWTTLDELASDHRNELEPMEPNLIRIGTRPSFGIGQHAYLLQAPGGNILWDCITLIDEPTISAVERLGGVSAIALSHPHYYSSIVEWSRAFGNAPVYIHSADRQWVTRPDPAVVLWEGDTRPLGEGLTLVRAGGHFAGGSMLHWAAGAGGRGALMAGDIIQVVHDRGWVSFMYSYVNYIPLPASEVRRVVGSVEAFEFDRIYSPWEGRVVESGAKDAVARSARRYIEAMSEDA